LNFLWLGWAGPSPKGIWAEICPKQSRARTGPKEKMWQRGEDYLEWGSAIVVVGGGWRRRRQRLGRAVAAAGILSFLCAETDFFLSYPALALLEFSFTFFCCYGLSLASPLSPLSIFSPVFSLKSSPVFLLCFFRSLLLLSKLFFFSTLSVCFFFLLQFFCSFTLLGLPSQTVLCFLLSILSLFFFLVCFSSIFCFIFCVFALFLPLSLQNPLLVLILSPVFIGRKREQLPCLYPILETG